MVSFGSGIQKNVTDEFKRNDLFTTLQVTPGGLDLDDLMSGNVERDKSAPVLDDEAIAGIQALPDVKIAFPEIRFPVKIRIRDREATTSVRAMPAAEGSRRPFDSIPYGRFFEGDGEPSVVLSQRVLRDLGIEIEEETDRVSVAPADSSEALVTLPADSLLGRDVRVVTSVIDEKKLMRAFLRGVPPSDMPFREQETLLSLVGIRAQPTGFDEGPFGSGVIVPIATAMRMPKLGFSSVQEILGRGDEAAGYESAHVRVERLEDLEPAREAIEAMGFGVISAGDRLDEFKRGFLIMDSMLGAIGTIALFVAALGIINTMVTSILERTREIGIMMAIGGSERDIRRIFFVEAATIGIAGGIFGLFLGWAVTRLANVVANNYIRPQGFAPVDLFYIPLWLILGALAFSLVVSLLAALYPAARAARVDPVQALRHD
jgi:putative ABC transport system permease protein